MKDALKDIGLLEDGISDLDKAADESNKALDKIGEGGEEAAKDVEKAFRGLGITSAASLKKQADAAQDNYDKIVATVGEGTVEAGRAWDALQRKVSRINRFMATDTKKTFKDATADIGKSLQGIGSKITARATTAAAAAGAAGAALIKNSSENALAVGRAASVSGLDFDQIQGLGFAAGTVGIEIEDVADKLKDVNDKFGDFFETGAGPLADFFENVTPKIGRTAESLGEIPSRIDYTASYFKKLNSADRLQAFVNALEASGKSLEDGATFYLEGVASDSTKLLELFKDNGAELNRLAQIGRDTGGFFTEEDYENAKEMLLQVQKISASMDGLGAALSEAGVVDAFVTLTEYLASFVSFLTEYVNPGVLKFAAAIGIILAVVGPIIAGIGWIVMGISALVPLFTFIGGVIAAIAGAIATVVSLPVLIGVAIVAAIAGIIGLIVTFRKEIGAFFTETLPGWISSLGGILGSFFADLASGIVSYFMNALKEGLAFGKSLFEKLGFLKLFTGSDDSGSAPGFRSGGYTGNGGEGDAAGIVHGREFVLNAAATRFYGRDILDSMNRRMMPPALTQTTSAVAAPSSGRRVSIDLGIGSGSYPIQTDADTAERLERDLNRSAATKASKKPRNMR